VLSRDGSIGTKVIIGNYQFSLPKDYSEQGSIGKASLAPGGRLVMVLPPPTYAQNQLTLFHLDGSKIVLKDSHIYLTGRKTHWYDEKRLVLSTNKQGLKIFLLIDINTTPASVMLLDSDQNDIELINWI
jgi:hypothetical protein